MMSSNEELKYDQMARCVTEDDHAGAVQITDQDILPGAKKNSDTQSDTKRKMRSKMLNIKTKGLPDALTGISPAKSTNELLAKPNTR